MATAAAEIPATAKVWQLTHRTEYVYDDEVFTSYGRAHLIPRHGAGQYRLAAQVEVDPAPADLREHTDFFGNRSTYFSVRTPHRELSVTATSRVAVDRGGTHRDALRDVRARDVHERLHDRADLAADLNAARQYLLPSPMIGRAEQVAEFAQDLMRPARSLDEVVADLLDRIHDGFSYVSGSTTVRTTLAEVLASREGVCQDFAHLAVAALRSMGLAARYVSGYLETQPPPGKPRLVGADASHAWASVFAPGVGWVDLDPTNHKFVDDSYIVTAVGRDYSDVPPLKGVIYTESKKNTLKVSVDMVPIVGDSST
ncbi:transglutaminase family protein [Sporichthya sp.]|uniref:transglutaminase family protein n=1 Tax=Sporichthya sp. TaxID=65475 RepID=UPI001829DE10|nr:transglutaminase family protein [Sporichthya sp.]MBA3742381.1 transglutaminase family protein [Sporichthya sp.]